MGTDKNKHLRSFRIKIDGPIQQRLQQELSDADMGKQELIGLACDWFVEKRVTGVLPPRYFVSPHDSQYECLWLREETAKRLHDIASSDGTKASRVLYTALARYIENLDKK
ncbi:hypothetical protein [Dickeya sp. NCPPB 3274]|uniref:hypothetical protein n=1 Tax=Dickeya sp. NCPPB 3274 TaxID=568766 RepID=UPI0005B37988|nr:hypothetical protein [Dickeya sp. NCPPB 3274]